MGLFRFERLERPVASQLRFLGRFGVNLFAASLLILAALGAGMWGYHRYEGLDWLDAFLNASMLLAGMGPIDLPKTVDGKLFAGAYALVCGLIFVVTAGVILAPVLHRVLHALHVDCDD